MAFPTTRWTLLAQATLNGDAAGRAALEELCRKYHRPVIVWLEVRGLKADAAQDTAQDLFLKLLDSRLWKRADRQRGRFRTFLLGVLNNLMLHAARADQRLKRGGGLEIDSLNELEAAGLEFDSPAHDSSAFDREWAQTLVEDAMKAVEHEYAGRGHNAEFDVLRRFLPGFETPPSYEVAADVLGLSLAALKAAVHRLRQRFREVLRTAVARTVSAPHEVDEELRYLGSLLAKENTTPRNSAPPTGKMSQE